MYSLHLLGWKSFQELCLTIVRDILGQTVESFLDSNDGGQDGAFGGMWQQHGYEDLSGRFVIQCKHTSREEASLTLSDLSDELKKIDHLVMADMCDSYVLMTNAKLSGANDIKIEKEVRARGVKQVRLLGMTWITEQIKESKRLRMLVPRLYGLGDLSQILDERAYRQAQAVLNSLREDLSKVVITEAYRKAASAIDRHGFVLLTGEPAAGKTTIASMLAMTAVDQWDASLMKLSTPEDVASHWNPDEPSQFFWIDDAFGVSQYEKGLVYGWNRIFPLVKPMLSKGAKVVMTSRDYIYNRARQDLKESAFPILQESQVVIDVHKLPENEKKQILYNHLKLGNQPTQFLTRIKPYLEGVAAKKEFIPEIARRLSEPVFTKDLHLSQYYLDQFVEKPAEFLFDILKGLDAHSKAALALIFIRSDKLESPIELSEVEKESVERLSSTLGECIRALDSLNGSLVLNTVSDGESFWRFKHPTIGDSFARLLIQSPELLGIYLRGISTERLLTQITCGDMAVERAIIIPKRLFPEVLEKINKFTSSNSHKEVWRATWEARSSLDRFLSWRCSRDFLSIYVEQNPEVLSRAAHPGLYLSASSEVGLARTLNEYGLLPEDKRREFVSKISQYALNGEDLYALENESIRSIFKGTEFEDLRVQVKSDLFPRLPEVRREVETNFDSDGSSDEHMDGFLETLNTLSTHFGDDPEILGIVEKEREAANAWIEENKKEDIRREPRILGEVDEPISQAGTRSIFDDIDL